MTIREKFRLMAKLNRVIYALEVAPSPHTLNPATYLEQASNILQTIKEGV